MDQRAIIDVICRNGLENLSGEVSALLGQDLTCSDIRLGLTTKARLFNDPGRNKSALTCMTVSGDREGHSYLLTRISTAAILAGTLIMLPEDMIAENAGSEQLEGELNDAFGEVANIIAGIFTQSFVDKYSKTIRFIKQTVEELIPTKIDVASDNPFPPGQYYVASCTMTLGETDLGLLELIVPADIFELEAEETEAADQMSAAAPAPTARQEARPTPVSPAQTSETPPVPPAGSPKKPSFVEAKKLVDVVFKTTISQAGEEVGALLGQTLKSTDIQLSMTTKAEFFSSHCIEKSILTHLKVTGSKEGLGYMAVQVPDAIILGGTLIMLPEDQIEEQKQDGTFDGEVADAFGEIANILAGSLTQVFLDRYPQPLRFIKTDSETVVPTKIDPASEAPFAAGDYYLASFSIAIEGFELDRIQFIFPAEIFDLDNCPTAAPEQTSGSAAEVARTAATVEADSPGSNQPAPGEWGGAPLQAPAFDPPQEPQNAAADQLPAPRDESGPTVETAASHFPGPPVVLIISDQKDNTVPYADILTGAGYDCRTLSFQDEVRELFRQHQVLGIFLVMAKVGEKGFAAAIKLQAAGQSLPPIIFAGPEWTRTAVLRAVKYGAKDILVTPASTDEIQDKVALHIKKAS